MKRFLVFALLICSSLTAQSAPLHNDDSPLSEHMRAMYTTFDKMWANWDKLDTDLQKQDYIENVEAFTKQLTSTLFHIPSKLVRKPEDFTKRIEILQYRADIIEMLSLSVQLEKTVIEPREAGDAESKRKHDIAKILQKMSTLIAQGHQRFRTIN